MNEKESMLQKEFKSRDVSRMRNLVTKKFDAETGDQVGYKKDSVVRIEGDVWTEKDKQWTIKNGIKMTISKLDEVKSILQMPLICPNCHKPMLNVILDKKMYSMHKKCFDCVIENETKLRQDGKFDEYQKNIMTKNIDTYICELDDIFDELCNSADESFVTEEGDIEQWEGGSLNIHKIKEEFNIYRDSINKTRENM